MKDARRGLHSLVEAQNWLRNPVDLLELNEHSQALRPNLSLINDKSSHGDIYNLKFDFDKLRSRYGLVMQAF